MTLRHDGRRLHLAADGVARALADAEPEVYWSSVTPLPDPAPELASTDSANLVIAGGGFTGLWAAIQAKEEDPGCDVVILEAETIGSGASGRNGGFVDASLTHGLLNGVRHFGAEAKVLHKLGLANLRGIARTLAEHHIDADWDARGMLYVATEEYQLAELGEQTRLLNQHAESARMLDARQTRAEVNSPTYHGACLRATGKATVNPLALARGLRRAAESLGVRVYEHSPVQRLTADRAAITAATARGQVRARRAVVGTNAYPPPLRAIRRYVVPVYDYALVTEPLTEAQLAAVGWGQRLPVADSANRFHYYRLTPDNRILWGGYDAIYYFGNDMGPHREQRSATFHTLARHFFTTFPQLEGIRFTHRWAGPIDTSTRFCMTFGTAFRARAAYAVGYTGLGVAATRFGARVALDLVSGQQTERTALKLVRARAIPFPPEPLRWAGIEMTRRALKRADEHEGRRGLWLGILDRAHVGFDS